MCFSSKASFAASAILFVAGSASIRKIKSKEQTWFAAIPFIFAIQQFSEGFLWMSLKNPAHAEWKEPAMFTFLFFAQVVWPTWVPLSILLLEKEKRRRKMLSVFLLIGVSLSAWLAFALLSYPVDAKVDGLHIKYFLDFPLELHWLGGVFYFIPTVLSPFVSSAKKMPALGTIILLSFIVSKLFFSEYVISVWCFFAAVLSVVVYYVIKSIPATERITSN